MNGILNREKTKQQNVTNGNIHRLEVFQRKSGFEKIFGETLCPLFLISIIPLSTLFIWHVCRYYEGSFSELFKTINSFDDFTRLLYTITLGQWKGSFFALYVICGYFVWAILMTLYLPGKVYFAPITDKGNVPEYVNNGFLFYIVTLSSFLVLSVGLESYGYSVTIICDRYGEFVFTLNVFALVFCLCLYLKGMLAPSTSDNGTSGNPIFDYYWGVELYPRIGKYLDIKLLTNCRWGMMIWCISVILFWMKSLKVYGFVDSHFITMILIVSYLTKFFWWESGYMKTIDIIVDRAGFYLCYGCLCFVPSFYALPSIYLAYHPVKLGLPVTLLILSLGFLSLYLNYDADHQRVYVREKNGKCLVWNKEAKIIRAKYTLLDSNKQSESILLASGYWGISSHFHYIPELGLAFCWCTTAAFQNLMPYLYFIFLCALLTHRSIRDDSKCSNKYGKYWLEYRKLVPFKIIPYVF